MAYYKWQHADILKEARWLVMQMPPVKKKIKRNKNCKEFFWFVVWRIARKVGCVKKRRLWLGSQNGYVP